MNGPHASFVLRFCFNAFAGSDALIDGWETVFDEMLLVDAACFHSDWPGRNAVLFLQGDFERTRANVDRPTAG
jgi:hypothetical protein